MKFLSPAFGLMSGFCATLGFLPHLVALSIFLLSRVPSPSLSFLVVFAIGARFLGEWLFWNLCKKRMDSEEDLKNWRSMIGWPLLNHPNVYIASMMIFADIFIDVTLLYTALNTSISPMWVFLLFLGCQAIASPIQGGLSDFFSQKKSLLFASIVGMLAVLAIREIAVEGGGQDSSIGFTLTFLGLSTFTAKAQIFIILCGKGLFANLSMIARAAIAEVIKFKTVEAAHGR